MEFVFLSCLFTFFSGILAYKTHNKEQEIRSISEFLSKKATQQEIKEGVFFTSGIVGFSILDMYSAQENHEEVLKILGGFFGLP